MAINSTSMDRMTAIRDHMEKFLEIIHDLEKKGYHSGGVDNAFTKTAIFKGEYPNAELAGYIHKKDLTVELWF